MNLTPHSALDKRSASPNPHRRWMRCAYPPYDDCDDGKDVPAVAVVLLVLFLGQPAWADTAPAQGRAIYNYRCAYCHGYDGDGDTLAATFLTPPPASFIARDAAGLPPARIRAALRDGVAGSGMMSFAQTLSAEEMDAVAHYVHQQFVVAKARNTSYHTAENGWPDHGRYRAAFPFATREIPVSRSWDNLTPEQAAGKRLYLDACVTCHDRGRPEADPVVWEGRPVSWPRNPPAVDVPKN